MLAAALRFLTSQGTFIRFCAAGTVGFIVDAGLVQAGVSLFSAPPVPMRLVSFLVAVAVTWQINRTLTFPGPKTERASVEWTRYLFVNAVGAGVNLLVYTLLVINVAFLARYPFFAVAVASLIALAINYFSTKHFVFGARRARSDAARRRVRIILVAASIFAAVLVVQGAHFKDWNPVGDEKHYLGYAHSMLHHGVFGLPGAEGRPNASFFREPGYPAVIAVMMALDPRLRDLSPDCWRDGGPPCDPRAYRSLQWLNLALIGATALLLALTVMRLGAGWVPAVVAAGAIALNFEAQALRSYMMSDYLAMTLVALAVWLAVGTWRAPRVVNAACCGLALAALVLTKAVFLYFVVPAVAIAVIAGLIGRRDRWPAFAALALAALLPVMGWMGFQKSSGGPFAIVEGTRTGIALSGRERFNDMDLTEWAAAFLWWTRGFGDNLARDLLPPDAYRRLNDGNREGFFQAGEARYYVLRDEVMAATDLGATAANDSIAGDMAGRILDRPFKHVMVSVPLAYRGVWIDEFALLSVPSLFVVVIAALRRRRWAWLLALAPGLYSLGIYPLASINIPRYQLTALPVLALALALALSLWLERRRARRQA